MNFLLYSILPFLAAAAPAPGGANQGANGDTPGPGLSGLLFPLAVMFLIFYVLIIRPQKKMQKQKKQMIEELQKHDEVITRGGIIGTIIEVRTEKDEVLVEISKGARIRLRRPAIEGVIPKEKIEAKG